MKIGYFKNTCAKAGLPIMESMAKGILNSKNQIKELEKIQDIDETISAVIIWSVLWTNPLRKEIYDFCIKKKIPILVLEVGGIIRNITWKVGIGGINASANFLHKKSPEDRRKKLGITLEPYQNNGKNIVICGQHEKSGAWYENFTIDWVNYLISEIRKYTDRKIIFRPHPRFKVQIPKHFDCEIHIPKFIGNYDDYDFKDELKNTYLLINYNSNPAIEATINGVHVYTDVSSLCYEVSIKNLKNLNNLHFPKEEREIWANNIAYTEWFKEEIEEGIPYRRLRDFLL